MSGRVRRRGRIDLADQLTPAQVRTLDRIEADLLARDAPADQVAATLLDHARYHAQHNLCDTAMFGHLPTPTCARFLNHFEDEGTGSFLRRFDGCAASPPLALGGRSSLPGTLWDAFVPAWLGGPNI